jgi:hypothetical protein
MVVRYGLIVDCQEGLITTMNENGKRGFNRRDSRESRGVHNCIYFSVPSDFTVVYLSFFSSATSDNSAVLKYLFS